MDIYLYSFRENAAYANDSYGQTPFRIYKCESICPNCLSTEVRWATKRPSGPLDPIVECRSCHTWNGITIITEEEV